MRAHLLDKPSHVDRLCLNRSTAWKMRHRQPMRMCPGGVVFNCGLHSLYLVIFITEPAASLLKLKLHLVLSSGPIDDT